ncbi:hypothetical protein [Vibrio sonorensis]|uniref:hypothetical protein n=1 Tax=Vibrio sonorensis TaxID=1004316 RepID=UPI0008DAB5C4|nr:hypothetical protein [Vibrio sonorensis]
MQEKFDGYISTGNTNEHALITDIQYGEKFSSAALNRHWKNIKPVGIYAGFEPVISGVDTVTVGDASGRNTLVAQTASGEYQLTVHQQKPITLTVARDQDLTAVVEAFFAYGVVTKQVDTDSLVDAATLKLIPTAEVKPHHVALFRVLLPAAAPKLLPEHLITDVRVDANIAGAYSRNESDRNFVRKTADQGAMIVPFSSDDNNPPDGLERWNPEKRRIEYSRDRKWHGVGGGGSTLKTVNVDTLLGAGEGCLVNTTAVKKTVTVTLQGKADASEGNEHIVGDVRSGSAFKYPVKVIAQGATTVNGEPYYLINVDGARLTFNYDAQSDNWEISSGFGERPVPKSVFDSYESKPAKGTSVFHVDYHVGYVDIYLNGAQLCSNDFTATDGKTITLHQPTKRHDDVVQIKAWRFVDQLQDVSLTRKEWSGKAERGAVSLPANGLNNDLAKAYYLQIGGVRQQPTVDYSISSLTNEVLLAKPLDNPQDWYLLSEAEVQLFEGIDHQINATNTNNSLTGKNVKENIDELDTRTAGLNEVGSVIWLAHEQHPEGKYIKPNGYPLKMTEYPQLYEKFGSTYTQQWEAGELVLLGELRKSIANGTIYKATKSGTTAGTDVTNDTVVTWVVSNEFQNMDMRGVHFRALDEGRGLDPNRKMGEFQGDAIRNIKGTSRPYDGGGLPSGISTGAFRLKSGGGLVPIGSEGVRSYHEFDASLVVPTAHENRGVNMPLVPWLRYKR